MAGLLCRRRPIPDDLKLRHGCAPVISASACSSQYAMTGKRRSPSLPESRGGVRLLAACRESRIAHLYAIVVVALNAGVVKRAPHEHLTSTSPSLTTPAHSANVAPPFELRRPGSLEATMRCPL